MTCVLCKFLYRSVLLAVKQSLHVPGATVLPALKAAVYAHRTILLACMLFALCTLRSEPSLELCFLSPLVSVGLPE